MAPMINSVQDAEKAVHYCRYPPLGRRGLDPFAPAGTWHADQMTAKQAATLKAASLRNSLRL